MTKSVKPHAQHSRSAVCVLFDQVVLSERLDLVDVAVAIWDFAHLLDVSTNDLGEIKRKI